MSKSVECPSCKEKNNPSFKNCWKCGTALQAGISSIEIKKSRMPATAAIFCSAAIGCVVLFVAFMIIFFIRTVAEGPLPEGASIGVAMGFPLLIIGGPCLLFFIIFVVTAAVISAVSEKTK